MEKKLTKKDYYEILKTIVEGIEVENKEDLLTFIDRELELIENKSAKAKVRAAEKKAEGDELRATVKAILTTENQTIDEIFGQIEGEDLTRAKIVARLTQLVNSGEAKKEEVKSEEGKRIMVYALAD